MIRSDYWMVAVVAVAWGLYLLGIDNIPGWDGFGRGLVGGSIPGVGVYLIFRYLRRREGS